MSAFEDNQKLVCTIAPTEYVFISKAIFISQAKDRVFWNYYFGEIGINTISGGILCFFAAKVLQWTKYLALHDGALWKEISASFTVLAMKKC